MPADATPPAGPTRRGVGMRAGLSIGRIIDAARTLEPDAVTMQAVADRLGVDRKALNHHVSGREALLALVALDAFAESFCAVRIEPQATWQDACRVYATALTHSVIATGVLAERVRLDDAPIARVLEPTEALLQKLVDAGFDDENAMRTLSLMTNICLAYARDVAARRQIGDSPRPVILRSALQQHRSGTYPALERIARLSATTYDDRQLELSIETFIAGTETILARAGHPAHTT